MTTKVLLIDDEQICIDSVLMMLEGTDYELLHAFDGASGLELLRQNPETNLLLLDLMLTDMHGVDILKTIKSSEKLSHIPVIIQTGCNNEKDIAKCLEFGAYSCIFKPYKKHTLLETLNKLAATSH
ncbi:MAG: response regulator [Sphingobacteriia bacterium]|nr:response regulator [Sphingobacteriia bacterium]